MTDAPTYDVRWWRDHAGEEDFAMSDKTQASLTGVTADVALAQCALLFDPPKLPDDAPPIMPLRRVEIHRVG